MSDDGFWGGRSAEDVTSLARAGFEIEFEGRGAHAGVSFIPLSGQIRADLEQAAPWLGINALDAAVQGCRSFSIFTTCPSVPLSALDTAVSMLRQQLEPTMRVHGVILGSERWAQNIIPSCEGAEE